MSWDLGDVLIWTALGSGLLALAAGLSGRELVARRAFNAHAATLVGALALLVAYFLAARVSIEYVWAHTHAAYPWYYRLAGVWAGQEGTLLMWTAFAAAAFALEGWRRARSGSGSRAHRAAQVFMLLFTVSFTGLLTAASPFEATDASLLRFASTAQGRGLQEVLVTPLMVIHPPLQFLGYALMSMPAALALGGAWARDDAWVARAYRWARPAWAVATLGLGLGGLWAYYVLSFGGYWAWDPVETANLLPWLALTIFLHAGKYRQTFADFALATPVMAFLAWWLTVFSTFATRSGWWVSVHAFTDPASRFDPDALSRLLAIMQAHPPTTFFLGLLGASILGAAAVLLRARGGRASPRGVRVAVGVQAFLAGVFALAPLSALSLLFEAAAWTLPGAAPLVAAGAFALLVSGPLVFAYLQEDSPQGVSRRSALGVWLAPRPLMTGGVVVFSIGLAVLFILNLQAVNGFSRTVFDARAPFVALPLVLLMSLALGVGPLGGKRALTLGGVGVAAALVGVLLFPQRWPLAASLPVLGAGVVATVVKLVHVNRSPHRGLTLAGALLLLAALTGLVMWSNPPDSLRVGEWSLRAGGAIGVLGFVLSAGGLLGAVAALHASDFKLALTGGALATLAGGYGVGGLMGLCGLALVLRHRAAFAREVAWTREASRYRQTGIYLVHFAVCVGLIGVALTTPTYNPGMQETFREVAPGDTVHVGGYAITLAQARGEGGASGLPGLDRVVVDLRLAREADGASEGAGRLEFYWKGAPINHYDPALDIQRRLTGDLYIEPQSFCIRDPCSEQGNWFRAHGDATRFASEDVRAATFRVVVLPMMTLVWAGLWLMVSGMLLVMGASWVERGGARAGTPDS